jgi:hypothetical protein
MTDRLEDITRLASAARVLEAEILRDEIALSHKKARLQRVLHDQLPSLMSAAGVDDLSLQASDDLPATDFSLGGYYRASIPVSWSAERRQEAFSTLRARGADGLIKTNVQVQFARGSSLEARVLADSLAARGYEPSLSETVHSSTLSAWLRELYSSGLSLTQDDLDRIGGNVGQIVRMKPRE